MDLAKGKKVKKPRAFWFQLGMLLRYDKVYPIHNWYYCESKGVWVNRLKSGRSVILLSLHMTNPQADIGHQVYLCGPIECMHCVNGVHWAVVGGSIGVQMHRSGGVWARTFFPPALTTVLSAILVVLRWWEKKKSKVSCVKFCIINQQNKLYTWKSD